MLQQMVRRVTCLASMVVSLVAAAPAAAEVRHASSSATPGDTSCDALTPCALDAAIHGATSVDEVIIAPGTYDLSTPLTLTQPIHVHGDPAGARPVIRGAVTSTAPTLTVSARATLTHVQVESAGDLATAIQVDAGATLDRVVAVADTGFAIDAVSDSTPTIIRNTAAVTHTTRTGTGAAGLRISDGANGGAAEVRNVTAYASGGDSTAIRCRTTTATTKIVNTVARGVTFDVDAGTWKGKAPKCPATASNARTAQSPGFSPTESTAPLFADAAQDDFTPQAGSGTIDRGTDDAANGALDLAGEVRTQGAATDVGALEFVVEAAPGESDPTDPGEGDPTDPGEGAPTDPGDGEPTGSEPQPDEPADLNDDDPVPTTTPPTAGAASPPPPGPTPTTPATPRADTGLTASPSVALPPAAPPELGRTMLLDTGKGRVLVKLPGTSSYVPFDRAASLPFGTTIDATKGEITLSTALPGGMALTGTFTGGLFEVRQRRSGRGMTDVFLRGDIGGCSRRSSKRALARAAGKRRGKRVRRLWAKDKGGRFRTHGRDSVAVVRGTRWLTEDRCKGTFTKVTEGAVDVRNKRTGRVKRLRAGQSVLVRR
jgi:hypothetical protein